LPAKRRNAGGPDEPDAADDDGFDRVLFEPDRIARKPDGVAVDPAMEVPPAEDSEQATTT